MTARRSVIEGRMLRELGMTEGAAARLRAHNTAQTDWHGWCRTCRTHRSGTIVQLGGPCPTCGAREDGTTSR